MSVIAISLETGLPSFYAVCQNVTCTGYFLGAMQICIARTSYGNVSVWLAVRHSRYCIKTTKPILKLFRPPGSAIIEAFGTPYADTKFQGNPFIRAFSTRGWEK